MGDFLHIAHTHPFEGVDVPLCVMTFGVLFDIHLSGQNSLIFDNIADIWRTVPDS